MVTIAEKINVVLAQRGLLKRDLARALGISPQTATDICKGRSAITLPHLRSLIRFFGLRADFWLDDERLEPSAGDAVVPEIETRLRGLLDSGLVHAPDPVDLVGRLVRFARDHQREFVTLCGELAHEELRFLASHAGGRLELPVEDRAVTPQRAHTDRAESLPAGSAQVESMRRNSASRDAVLGQVAADRDRLENDASEMN